MILLLCVLFCFCMCVSLLVISLSDSVWWEIDGNHTIDMVRNGLCLAQASQSILASVVSLMLDESTHWRMDGSSEDNIYYPCPLTVKARMRKNLPPKPLLAVVGFKARTERVHVLRHRSRTADLPLIGYLTIRALDLLQILRKNCSLHWYKTTRNHISNANLKLGTCQNDISLLAGGYPGTCIY